MNLENKIVLAIAIRVSAERFMVDRIANPEFVASIEANQAYGLTEKFKDLFPAEQEAEVVPENRTAG